MITIFMVPKDSSPQKVTQFRLISLSNVVYKVIFKMVVARLKVILSEVISLTQSAFVPGRMITDNVLVAYEYFHKIKNKKMEKKVCLLSSLTCIKLMIELNGFS